MASKIVAAVPATFPSVHLELCKSFCPVLGSFHIIICSLYTIMSYMNMYTSGPQHPLISSPNHHLPRIQIQSQQKSPGRDLCACITGASSRLGNSWGGVWEGSGLSRVYYNTTQFFLQSYHSLQENYLSSQDELSSQELSRPSMKPGTTDLEKAAFIIGECLALNLLTFCGLPMVLCQSPWQPFCYGTYYLLSGL